MFNIISNHKHVNIFAYPFLCSEDEKEWPLAAASITFFLFVYKGFFGFLLSIKAGLYKKRIAIQRIQINL